MTGSVYQKTALPAKLDLTKYNTREQLKDDKMSKAGSSAGAAEASTNDCRDVMRKDLREWLEQHDIKGPPPNAVAEQKAMWAWIRDFHQEYNEDWFSRNMPRLHEQFKPVFVQEMKAMKTAAKAAAQSSGDMLDFEAPAAPAAAAAPPPATSSGMSNLLDMDEPAPAPAAAAPAAPYAANLDMGGLLDLDMGGGSAASAGGYAGSSGPAAAPPAGGDLLDPFCGMEAPKPAQPPGGGSGLAGLNFDAAGPGFAAPAGSSSMAGLDFGSSMAATPAALPPTAAPASGLAGLDCFGDLGFAAPAPAPTVPPAAVQPSPSKGLDLLDLM